MTVRELELPSWFSLPRTDDRWCAYNTPAEHYSNPEKFRIGQDPRVFMHQLWPLGRPFALWP